VRPTAALEASEVQEAHVARLGLLRSVVLFCYRLIAQLTLGAWMTFVVQRLLPAGGMTGISLAAVHAAAALCSSSMGAATSGLPVKPARLLLPLALALRFEIQLALTSSLATQPLTPSVYASAAAVALATWRVPARRRRPRASYAAALAVTVAAAAFWLAVLIGALKRMPVELTVDGTVRVPS
jgi:hypothetical protein